MTAFASETVTIQDREIAIGQDRVQVRCWTPQAARPGSAPILLFHDSLGCIALWRDFPADLARACGRSVVAYDRPGFGQSSARTDIVPASFIADEGKTVVPALCEGLGLSRFVALGHSVGGGMAVHTAGHLQDRVDALVTISAQAFVEPRTLEGIRTAKAGFADPDAYARLARHHGDKACWVLDAWTETWLSPAFANWTLEDGLGKVRCRTLALHGDQDEYGSIRHPQRIAERTGGEAMILTGTGHTPHRECPAILASAIRGFLDVQN